MIFFFCSAPLQQTTNKIHSQNGINEDFLLPSLFFCQDKFGEVRKEYKNIRFDALQRKLQKIKFFFLVEKIKIFQNNSKSTSNKLKETKGFSFSFLDIYIRQRNQTVN